MAASSPSMPDAHNFKFVDMVPKENYVEVMVPMEDLKEVQVGPLSFQNTKLGTSCHTPQIHSTFISFS